MSKNQSNEQLNQLAKNVRCLICDIDGVLTNGQFILFPVDPKSEQGDMIELKAFHSQDGLGLKLLQKSGIQVAWISGRSSQSADSRAKQLGIEHIYQGIKDKIPTFESLIAKLKIDPEQVAYIGDDLPDLSIMQRVGLPIAVANATPDILAIAQWTTQRRGGDGAVREACDWILSQREPTA